MRRFLLFFVPGLTGLAGIVLAGIAIQSASSWFEPLPTALTAPRAVAAGGGRLYVLDGKGWMRILDYDGALIGERRLVKTERGFPAGVAIEANGNLLVADTHEARVLRLDPAGEVLATFGSYGAGPGQFVYPQRFAMRDDEIFVTEYGFDVNNRVQVFGADGVFRRMFGSYGKTGGRFARACGVVAGPDGNVYVADGGHRVLRLSPTGEYLGSFGSEGREPGCLTDPYGMAGDDRHLYVVEYGTHRISRFTYAGEFAGVLGGDRPDTFRFPRDAAIADGYLFVADTENDRVVRITLADIPWRGVP